MTRFRVVAVDGPGGSGKSTVSRRVAERLGWVHLDTGAFYRAATLVVLRNGVDPTDREAVMRVVGPLVLDQQEGRMLVAGEDVSAAIRSPEVTAAVSPVSAIPEVRTRMVELQRAWVARNGARAVVEGRDIGTVVFPDTPVKVFLTADPAERARRRAAETDDDPTRTRAELARRDRLDSSRETSPLVPADDAVVLDTTHMTVDEVVGRVVGLAETAGFVLG